MFVRIRKLAPWAVAVVALFTVGLFVKSRLDIVQQYGDGSAAWVIKKSGPGFKVTVEMPNPAWANPTFTATKRVKTVEEAEKFARSMLTANMIANNGIGLGGYIDSLETRSRTMLEIFNEGMRFSALGRGNSILTGSVNVTTVARDLIPVLYRPANCDFYIYTDKAEGRKAISVVWVNYFPDPEKRADDRKALIKIMRLMNEFGINRYGHSLHNFKEEVEEGFYVWWLMNHKGKSQQEAEQALREARPWKGYWYPGVALTLYQEVRKEIMGG